MRSNSILRVCGLAIAQVMFWFWGANLGWAQAPDDAAQLPQQLDQFLTQIPQSKQPLADLGPDFVQWGSTYGVNPRLVVAISGAESSFGAHVCTQANAWNWFWEGPCPKSPFDSWDSGIKTVSHFLRKSYLLKGYNTIPLIGAKYCASGCEHWVPGVTQFYTELGGDLSSLTWPLQGSSDTVVAQTPARAPATIFAQVTSSSASSGHWWQKAAPSMTIEVHAIVHGAMPLAGSVKLVRMSAQGQQPVTTLHAEGSNDAGDMVFVGDASLPQLPAGESDFEVTAGFPKAASKAPVASNLISLTIAPPSSGSMLPLFLGLAAGVLVLLAMVAVIVLRLKRAKPPGSRIQQAA